MALQVEATPGRHGRDGLRETYAEVSREGSAEGAGGGSRRARDRNELPHSHLLIKNLKRDRSSSEAICGIFKLPKNA